MTDLDHDHCDDMTGGSIPMYQKSLEDWVTPFGCGIPSIPCP